MSRRKHGANILYLDIETAPAIVKTWSLWPKFISPNDVVTPGYMLSWAAMWDHERNVYFNKKGDANFLNNLYELMDEADMIVWYNGDAFDQKHINREFVLDNLPPPAHSHSLDLYKTVRKQFKFQSNKLDYVCQTLGLGGKVKHEGMGLWDKCIAGDVAAWRRMERYNVRDIKMLKQLYKRILPWIHNHPNLGMWVDDPTKPVCTNCASTDVHHKGTQHNTKTQSYLRYKCMACGTPLRGRFTTRPKDKNVLARTP